MGTKTRKRGVKASRAKLETAMLEAGIKTQVALANKIADIEKSATPPKDLINRTFRQENVSPNTIAKIARALNVEPYTLYLSKNENDLLQSIVTTDELDTNSLLPDETHNQVENLPSSKIKAFKKWYILTATIGLSAMVISYYLLSHLNKNGMESVAKIRPILGNYSIVLLNNSDTLQHMSEGIQQRLANYNIPSTLIRLNAILDGQDTSAIATQFQADAVLKLKEKNYGRYSSVKAYLYIHNIEKLIWTGASNTLEMQNSNDLVTEIMPYLTKELIPEQTDQLTPYLLVDDLDKMLKAWQLLDDYQVRLNLKTAQTYLYEILSRYSDYAPAYALICESLLKESISGNEKAILESAGQHCGKALSLSPNSTLNRIVYGNFLRKSGRVLDSISLFEELLEDQPNSSDANYGLALAYFAAFEQDLSEIPASLELAKQYGLNATKIDPMYWEYYLYLGNFYWYGQDISRALEQYEKSAALNATSLNLVNIGTSQICLGQFEQAISTYQKIHQIDSDSYLADEFMGMSFYYSGNFEQSLLYRQKALALIADNESGVYHLIIGALADSYRQVGEYKQAIAEYKRALIYLERDVLKNIDTTEDAIHKYYYMLMLSQLDPENYNQEAKNNLGIDLYSFLQRDFSQTVNNRLATIWSIEGDIKHAKIALDKATAICSTYFYNPDLPVELRKQHTITKANF
jgi:tetratricopeptide (TPR) repeat protein